MTEISTPVPEPNRGGDPRAGVPGTVSLWAGIVVAPLAWLTKFEVNYALVPWACAVPSRMILIHLITLVALGICGGAGYLSWREWVRAGRQWPSGAESSPVMRTRFLAVLGMMSSSLVFLITLAQGIAAFMLNPCWD